MKISKEYEGTTVPSYIYFHSIKKEEKNMQELQLSNQMEITGGGVGTWIVCVVVGAAVYKILISCLSA